MKFPSFFCAIVLSAIDQEAIEHLEVELDREKEERKRAEKRMRAAESAAIEIKNDHIMAREALVNT